MKTHNTINVTQSSMPPLEDYLTEIQDLWQTRWLTNMGAKHKQLEQELTSYLGVSCFSLFSNGHMALELLLQGMGLTGEVITTPFTFASTTHAIVRNGLTPVFGDIRADDYTLDAAKLEPLITERTSAILPVHVYGNICEHQAIAALANRYGLKVVYDAAHAFGERINGVGVGSLGDASMFSFHATKVFHTIEGGAVAFSDEELGMTLYRLKNFGIRSEVLVDGVGSNAKMNEFQAAMGLCNLRYIDGEIAKRQVVAERYRERLRGIAGLKLMQDQPGVRHNYAYFPVVFDETVFGVSRDAVYERLKQHNIFARKYFYPLTNTFDCYRGRFDVSATPVARYIAQRVLTLPLYAGLALEDVDRICDVILGVGRQGGGDIPRVAQTAQDDMLVRVGD